MWYIVNLNDIAADIEKNKKMCSQNFLNGLYKLYKEGCAFESWHRILDGVSEACYSIGKNKGSQMGHTKKIFEKMLYIED